MKTFGLALLMLMITHGVAYSEEPGQETLSDATSGTQRAETIKAEVQRRGVGERARVTLRLRDGSEAKGFISQIDSTSFRVTDPKTGNTSAIPYSTVEQIRSSGMSRGVKTAIWAGVGAGIAGIVILMIGASWHGN